MSKNALVIKGANFSANKLTTVEFNEEIPCTDIFLSDSTKTVTALGNFTLTATVTPNDTTDDVMWTTSDASVATVTAGVVSVVGLGTATITALCGNQSATCVVTCNEVTISPYYMFAKRQGLSSYPDIYAVATSKREITAADNTNLETIRTLKNQSSNTALDACPILLPANTDIIEITYGSDMRTGTIYFGWLDTDRSGDQSYPNVAYLVSMDSSNSTAYNTPKTWQYEVPSGANSFAVCLTTNSTDFTDQDTPDSIATAKGIVIKAKIAAA